jgi:hypothetical protein
MDDDGRHFLLTSESRKLYGAFRFLNSCQHWKAAGVYMYGIPFPVSGLGLYQTGEVADGWGEGGQLIAAEVQLYQTCELADGWGKGGQLVFAEVQVCHPAVRRFDNVFQLDEIIPRLPSCPATLAAALQYSGLVLGVAHVTAVCVLCTIAS